MITNYKKYIYKTYFYNLLKVSLVFISLSIIMNLFEEIDFLKESENPILLPLILTILNGEGKGPDALIQYVSMENDEYSATFSIN